MNMNSLQAMASGFQNGNSPDWYKNLPTGVRSYFAEVGAMATANGGGQTATGGPQSTHTTGETSTSSGLASRPTGVLAGGLFATLGTLGLAIVL